jgi:hypothetical protein
MDAEHCDFKNDRDHFCSREMIANRPAPPAEFVEILCSGICVLRFAFRALISVA